MQLLLLAGCLVVISAILLLTYMMVRPSIKCVQDCSYTSPRAHHYQLVYREDDESNEVLSSGGKVMSRQNSDVYCLVKTTNEAASTNS